MKAAEIQKLSGEDLQAKLKEARAELFNLRFQVATGQLDNTARIKQVKKDIAASRPRCATVNSRPLRLRVQLGRFEQYE